MLSCTWIETHSGRMYTVLGGFNICHKTLLVNIGINLDTFLFGISQNKTLASNKNFTTRITTSQVPYENFESVKCRIPRWLEENEKSNLNRIISF